MNTCTYLCEKGKEFWTIAGIVLVIVIAIIQFLAGYELAFSLFYLLPPPVPSVGLLLRPCQDMLTHTPPFLTGTRP
jgi:hypothetical protein